MLCIGETNKAAIGAYFIVHKVFSALSSEKRENLMADFLSTLACVSLQIRTSNGSEKKEKDKKTRHVHGSLEFVQERKNHKTTPRGRTP